MTNVLSRLSIPDSNYGAAKKALLDQVAVPPENIHPWPYLEGDPEAAATELGDTLQPFLNDALFDLTFWASATTPTPRACFRRPAQSSTKA